MNQFGEFGLKIGDGLEEINSLIINCLEALKADKGDEFEAKLGEVFLKVVELPGKVSLYNLAILANNLNSAGLLAKYNTANQLMVTVSPNSYESWFFLGHSREEIGLIEEAVQAYYKAIDVLFSQVRGKDKGDARWVDLADYHCRLAEVLVANDKATSALSIVSKALDFYKFSETPKPRPHKILGDVLFKMRLEHGATLAYEKALELHSKDSSFKLYEDELEEIRKRIGE